MTTPDFTDSFGQEFFNQRVACCTEGCTNEGVELTVLALPDGIIICGVCDAQLHELADDVVVTPPVIVLPVLEVSPPEPLEVDPPVEESEELLLLESVIEETPSEVE